MSVVLEKTKAIWPKVSKALSVPHSESDYKTAAALLDELIDEVKENENHPLASLMETLSTLIECFEAEHFPEAKGDPVDTLKFLMEEHGLSQGDLSEIGSQGVVSEILHRKRKLNLRQIKKLAEHFGVSPDVFIV